MKHAAFLMLLAGMATLAWSATGRAADLSAGLALDEKTEAELKVSLEKALELTKANPTDFTAVRAEIASARKAAERLVGLAQNEQKPREPDEVKLPDSPAVPFLDGVSSEQVATLWREQLAVNLDAALGILAGRRDAIGEWVAYADRNRPQARAKPIADAVREAQRAALLLSRTTTAVKVVRKEELFADDFSKGAENWLAFGQCITKNEGAAFRMQDEKPGHPDAMMWTKKEFEGDIIAEFTFIPHSVGARPGALFTICGRPRPGKDLSVCVGDSMDTYNFGIDGYHFSMHRGNTGLGNVRRVGPGLKMLASGKDPCPEIDKEYKVAVGKFGPVIFLLVDGKLIHNYYDAETYGPVLTAGRIGIRHWGGMDGSYKQFRVFRLEKAAE